MSSTSNASPSSSQGMSVEIVVQDPRTLQDCIFRSALAPLRSHMRFFEPIIAKRINEMKLSAASSSSGPMPPLTLRAKCDHDTFKWLLDWVNGNAPAMTILNVVSVTLASNFLQMRALIEESLLYLRSHLAEVVSSSIDLMALPVDLVLRLSRMVRDSDLAAVLQHLYVQNSTTHPNRVFVGALLQHYVYDRLGLERGGESEGNDAGGKSANNVCGAGVGGITLKSSLGLRWCRLCATLFDQAEMQRLIRTFQFSSPECPAQTEMTSNAMPPTSNAFPSSVFYQSNRAATVNNRDSNCSNNSGAPTRVGSSTTVRCVGPRGEAFTTHTESRRALPVVLDAPPLVKYDQTATKTSITAATMLLERWAWRIIGATRYVSCRRCFHLVPLVETPVHHCSSLPHKFASPDNVADDVDHLVRWFTYCAENPVYAEQGGLTPILFNGPRRMLEEEVVKVQLTPWSEPVESGAKGGDGIADGNCANTSATIEKGKKNSASRPSVAVASTNSAISFWAARPFYVAEVMDKGIVDVDIQNYVERQQRFTVEAQQRKASALFNPPQMRLASCPVVGQTASSSSPSPRLISSASGASSTGSLGRGKMDAKSARMRASARNPYGF